VVIKPLSMSITCKAVKVSLPKPLNCLAPSLAGVPFLVGVSWTSCLSQHNILCWFLFWWFNSETKRLQRTRCHPREYKHIKTAFINYQSSFVIHHYTAACSNGCIILGCWEMDFLTFVSEMLPVSLLLIWSTSVLVKELSVQRPRSPTGSDNRHNWSSFSSSSFTQIKQASIITDHFHTYQQLLKVYRKQCLKGYLYWNSLEGEGQGRRRATW
jgi:hypothetical protein